MEKKELTSSTPMKSVNRVQVNAVSEIVMINQKQRGWPSRLSPWPD